MRKYGEQSEMQNKQQSLRFKHKRDEEMFYSLHPLLCGIVFDIAYFCIPYNYTPTVTATLSDIEKDRALGRKSSTHREGRAVDLRTRDMPTLLRKNLIEYLTKKYDSIAAANKIGLKRLVVDEGDHLHIQIHKKYAKPAFVSLSCVFPKSPK